jgi:hypothetical protein
VLVEYGVLDGRVIAVVVGAGRLRLLEVASVDAVRREGDGLYLVLRLLARRRAAVTPALRDVAEQRLARLRALLVDPLGVDPDRELVIVPADLLQRVPWSALHPGPVSVSPSASFWVRALGPRPLEAGGVLLVAGPDLSAAGGEVERLAALHAAPVVLGARDSTVANVTAELATADLVHFACHGTVRADNPMFSGLVLADGALTVQELELRDLAPHRIVLAACEAAADLTYPGGEWLGFVSALLGRGTAGMVASLVLVPDEAAVPLMLGLHEHLRRGESLPRALHAARAEVDRDDPHGLVNWCGFTAFGAA